MAINSAQPKDLLPRDSLAVTPFPMDSHNTCRLSTVLPPLVETTITKGVITAKCPSHKRGARRLTLPKNYSAETIFHTHIVELSFFFFTQTCWMLPCSVHATLHTALITVQSPCWVSVGEKRYEENMAPRGWGCCAFWRFGSFCWPTWLSSSMESWQEGPIS